ncbi:MAG: DegT/DnrJ/EryC1/StrS family aminotransferase [Pseudomonadota bacterium]
MDDTLFVTRPFMPPLEDFLPYLEKIWEGGVLTNNGPFHHELEEELGKHLGVEHVALFANGTLALVTALQALRVSGEVITTPFSFPATSHSLLWNNLTPIFADIDPLTCNLDVAKVEAAITPQTTAILPVHCYGTPCNVEALQNLADVYGLMLIYDSAHAFDVKYKGQSLLSHGDLSVVSFHATKVFNTFEGGAIICRDERIKRRIDLLKNFGFANETTVTAPGINGKMSEFNSALGLLQLKHIDTAINARRKVADRYRKLLAHIPGIRLLPEHPDTIGNGSYFPIFIEEEFPVSRDELYFAMREKQIRGRRYFYPLISEMPMYRNIATADSENLAVAHRISSSVICLPIYSDMGEGQVDRVVEAIRSSL